MDYTYREFSKIATITIRTLRYYESLGLIQHLIKQQVKYLKEGELMKMQTIDLLQKARYTLRKSKNTRTMLSLVEELKKTKDMEMKEMY